MSADPSGSASLSGFTGSDITPQHAAAIRVDRACTELRRGRALALRTGSGWLLAAAVEALSPALWQQLQATGGAARLLLSAERLQALGMSLNMPLDTPLQTSQGPRAAAAPRALILPPGLSLLQLQQWAAVTAGPCDPSLLGSTEAAPGEEPAWAALLALCKRVRLIPAVLLLALPQDAGPALASAQVMTFDPADAAAALPGQAARLRRVSDARVPLVAEEDCTLVVFREVDGDAEHVAIIVGQPPIDAPDNAPDTAPVAVPVPVPVRLHSACLTGDLLGSLRCDCGPQLQRAVAMLAQTGGVLLYLAQEGRATGLANKLRAYRLQDTGLDTLQADRYLGFREDERDFTAAAAMLQALGYTRIQLLTNNPQKISALRQAGIDVIDRLPLHGQVNSHNERYIRTKQQAGHLVGDD